MGGGALGGNAETTLLAQESLEGIELGDGLAWVADAVELPLDETVEHSHEFAFIYARSGAHDVESESGLSELGQGEAAAVADGESHVHRSPTVRSVAWEIRLAAPGSPPLEGALRVFEGEPIEGIPDDALATFVNVLVPVGGRTSVHTHPGPEFIYQTSGRIHYQNDIIGTRVMGPGTAEGIPPEVPVQKRNPFERDAEFLSWFLVDPDRPFASPAAFAVPSELGDNLAALTMGGRVIGRSSVYGRNDAGWGAGRAIDGDPTTQWSSDGDGDSAWIQIQLARKTHVTSVGFWSRTMGTSAEILSFRVLTDTGQTAGPFSLEGPGAVYRFEVDLTATVLRFEAVESTGGNTGAVEIEVFGDPAPVP